MKRMEEWEGEVKVVGMELSVMEWKGEGKDCDWKRKEYEKKMMRKEVEEERKKKMERKE